MTALRSPAQALSYARSRLGVRYPNLCDRFSANCYGLGHSGYPSAIVHWSSIPRSFKHGGASPPGALLFWAIGSYGHIAPNNGDGTMYSNMGNGGAIIRVRTSVPHSAWGARYLGWTDPYFGGDYIRLGGTAPKPPPTAVPTVSLARLVRAAHLDPPAPQGHQTYPVDVRPVERALMLAKLLPLSLAADGSFGSSTVTAYAGWQRSLGYTGAAADGIPGATSLTRLGQKYGFRVVA